MAVVAVAPVVLLISFLWHPYFEWHAYDDFNENAEQLAASYADDPTRWAWSIIISAVGLALTVLLVFSVRSYLRAAGEQSWSFPAAALVTAGAVLIAHNNGMQLGVLAAIEAGASGEAVFDAADPWATGMYGGGSVLFGLGWLSLATAVYRSEVLSRRLTWVAVSALVVLTVALTWTWGNVVIGVAATVAAWPLAYQMWVETQATAVAGAQPSPA